ncbi:MAG: endonuclease/exonuclease/phosphatase family protein, partial [Phenylobacterium sp.]|nr:endonuclease/exonuclease/phosphatase family protein [Phenylobacterium sp.]
MASDGGRSRRLGIVLAGLGVLAGVAALLAQGGRVSGILDVLTHFAPLYVLGGLLGLVAGLWRGRVRWTGLIGGFVGVVGGGALMAPEYLRPDPRRAPVDAPGRIKVIQINAFKNNADIERVVDWLVAEDPDIVTIQEARHDLRDRLRKQTGWQVAGAAGNLMIFSRERRLSMTRPKPPGRELNFVNATYPSASGPYEVVTAHLDWPTAAAYPRQYHDLAAVVAARPRSRMILTGDFNTAPWSFAMRRADGALGLQRLDRAAWSFPARLGPTPWPAPFLPIDHVYAGAGWRLVSLRRGPNV